MAWSSTLHWAYPPHGLKQGMIDSETGAWNWDIYAGGQGGKLSMRKWDR